MSIGNGEEWMGRWVHVSNCFCLSLPHILLKYLHIFYTLYHQKTRCKFCCETGEQKWYVNKSRSIKLDLIKIISNLYRWIVVKEQQCASDETNHFSWFECLQLTILLPIFRRSDITVRFIDENNKELGRDYFIAPSGQCTVSGYGNIKTITPRGKQ